MKAIVDADTCTGCGLCPSVCPEVFDLNDDGIAFVKADPVPTAAEETARAAAEDCPVDAITIKE